MTDYLYEGPAVLAINDAEIDVYARLAVLQSRGVDDTTWWANLAFHPLRPPTEDTPCTLRLPGGWKWNGRIPAGSTCMLGNSPPPARVQPPATDTTMTPTAELDHLRQEAARLDRMLANLQAHIDERAAELAQPHIEEADERVAAAEERCRELRDASWSARREHARRTEALEDRASRAETAIGCAMATVRVNTRSEPATDYARGYQACADHVTRALHSDDQQEADRG